MFIARWMHGKKETHEHNQQWTMKSKRRSWIGGVSRFQKREKNGCYFRKTAKRITQFSGLLKRIRDQFCRQHSPSNLTTLNKCVHKVGPHASKCDADGKYKCNATPYLYNRNVLSVCCTQQPNRMLIFYFSIFSVVYFHFVVRLSRKQRVFARTLKKNGIHILMCSSATRHKWLYIEFASGVDYVCRCISFFFPSSSSLSSLLCASRHFCGWCRNERNIYCFCLFKNCVRVSFVD